MWPILLLTIVALVAIKLVKVSLFWKSYGIPYESFPRYVYRMLWLFPTRVVVEVVQEDVKRYGPVYGSYSGLKPMLVVSDMEFAKEVFIKQFSNFFKRTLEFQTGDPLWDNILMLLPYDQWKSLRTVMGNTMTASKMRGIVPKFDKVAKRLVRKYEKMTQSSGCSVTPREDVKAYAVESMAAVSFGMDANCIEDPDSAFTKHSEELLKPGLTMLIFFITPALMRYVPFLSFPPKATSEFFGRVGRHAIESKKPMLDQVIADDTADMLDLHLIAQRNDASISDETLASQALLFLIAGIDGITIALTLLFYQLALHPEVQDTAYDEVMAATKGRTYIQYEDIQEMKYVQACILECLRLAPMVGILDRVCTADTQISGIPIQKGMVIQIPVAAIHRNPSNFAEPQRFRPERFLKGGVDQENSAFFLFGSGPKQCVGRRLALMNIQTLAANLLLKFRIDRDPETPVPLSVRSGLYFTTFEKKPVVVRLVPR